MRGIQPLAEEPDHGSIECYAQYAGWGNHGLYELALYRAEMAQGFALNDAASSLWDWDYPNLPMDLCFFNKGVAWFVSSAHERFAYISIERVLSNG